ncbi:MAG: sporulation protein YqfD [Eubacteriales bacterium]
MSRVMDFLYGYYRLTFLPEAAGQVLDILFRYGIENSSEHEAEAFVVRLRPAPYSAFTAIEEAGHIGRQTSALRGLPAYVAVLRRRPGVTVGAVLAVFLYLLVTSFVWEVRIESATGVDEDAILEELSTLGMAMGAFRYTLDCDDIAARYLQHSEQIGWMAIHLRGTVAEVEVIEKKRGEATRGEQNPHIGANLVAASDAVIHELLIADGRAAVRVGGVVKAGDLLVSGVYDTAQGPKITYARGEVLGVVSRDMVIEIPLDYTVNIYGTGRTRGLTLRILGLQLPLLDRASVGGQTQVFTKSKQLYLFDMIRLPVSVQTTYELPCREEVYRLTELQALKLAHRRLQGELELLLSDATLLSKQVSGVFEDGCYRLHCEVVFIENIAKPLEFLVD